MKNATIFEKLCHGNRFITLLSNFTIIHIFPMTLLTKLEETMQYFLVTKIFAFTIRHKQHHMNLYKHNVYNNFGSSSV